MRVDLHCHSKWSKRPSLWLMQKINCPESFSEPLAMYRILREKGMDAVTITDHNVIDGALEIGHLPNAFVGCEYTTYFPVDNCKVHILVYRQSERQHRELTEARKNIFDLVSYLQQSGLPHVCAHPFFWINDRLTLDHVEQLVLLFKNWELNGDMNPTMNDAVSTLVRHLNRTDIERLSNKHGFAPRFDKPWEKNFTSGSDDHSCLGLATSHTEVNQANDIDEFFAGIDEGQTVVSCGAATPNAFSRRIYSIAYQFYKSRFDLAPYVEKDVFLNFLDRTLTTPQDATPQAPPWYHVLRSRRRAARNLKDENSIFQIARHEAERLILGDPKLMTIVKGAHNTPETLDWQWYDFVTQVTGRVLHHVEKHFFERILKGQFFDIFHTAGAAGALYTLLAPYFVSYSLHRKEQTWSREVLEHFHGEKPWFKAEVNAPRVAHFTDTYYEVNGVARTLQQHRDMAHQLEIDYEIITCIEGKRAAQRGIRHFNAVGSFSLPEYPENKLLTPPFLEILHHCYEAGYTHIHAATPGPMGLAALGVARILHLPISGTYHTAFPQYGKNLTEDRYVEDMLWKAMIWFYDQMDAVFVPSQAFAKELLEHGITADKIKDYPRGCDIERFHPDQRCNILQKKFSVPNDDSVKILYVGRISREKNLPVLVETFWQLYTEGINVRLVVVGDGPYREEMAAALVDAPAHFTGYVEGDDLARIYASCDVMVFPSTTDTFGNVVLEAQASGIPIIVSDQGGPQENLIDGETGFVVKNSTAEGFAAALRNLCTDEGLRQRMGSAARCYMSKRGFAGAFEELFAVYTDQRTTPNEIRDDLPFSGLLKMGGL